MEKRWTDSIAWKKLFALLQLNHQSILDVAGVPASQPVSGPHAGSWPFFTSEDGTIKCSDIYVPTLPFTPMASEVWGVAFQISATGHSAKMTISMLKKKMFPLAKPTGGRIFWTGSYCELINNAYNSVKFNGGTPKADPWSPTGALN